MCGLFSFLQEGQVTKLVIASFLVARRFPVRDLVCLRFGSGVM